MTITLLVPLAILWMYVSKGFAIIPNIPGLPIPEGMDLSFISNGTPVEKIPIQELNTVYWLRKARSSLRQRLEHSTNYKAKNVIFFIGDGMSLSTQMAARFHKGQLKGNPGEEEQLSFEKFPTAGLVKTYCTDAQTPDSACTSTAYCCGVKANMFTLGVSPNVFRFNCSASMDPKNQLESIAGWAQAHGMSTGFVTTTTLTHASPAGLYGHSAFRFWESDREVARMGQDPSTCIDLARQLVTQQPGCNFNVMMGGGMNKLVPNTTMDAHGNLGHRMDGRNLVNEWLGRQDGSVVVTNRNELLNLNLQKVKKVMGLFASGEMDFHVDADPQKQPTLLEMTKVALDVLKQNPKGYFLFVEGGRIDHANHANKLQVAVDETLEMDKAVQLTVDQTDRRDTLIVVSADHGHPLSIAGGGQRGDDIFDLNPHMKDLDKISYFNANYAFGTKQYHDKEGNPIDMSDVRGNVSSVYAGHVNMFGGHSDDDVGVFAHGPQCHLFTGVLEQNELPHIMAYAACIGAGTKVCDGGHHKHP